VLPAQSHALLLHAACALATPAQLHVSASSYAFLLSGALLLLLLLLLLAMLSACTAANTATSTLRGQFSMLIVV
jgi:hypothetical protein